MNKNLQAEKNQSDIMKSTGNPYEQNGWNDIGDIKEEIWKPIKMFEDRYLISSYGRIKSLFKNIILKLNTNSQGYYVVGLCKHSKTKWGSVHRIVAMHFVSNPDNKPQVNHKDGNKFNNYASNLEWCTAKENVNHSIKNGLNKIIGPGDDHQGAKLNIQKVKMIRDNFLSGSVSVNDLCKDYDVKELAIRRIIHNKTWVDSNYEQYKNQVKLNLKKWERLHKSRHKKLTEEQINKIISLHKERSYRQKEIARMFNVDRATILRVIKQNLIP